MINCKCDHFHWLEFWIGVIATTIIIMAFLIKLN